MPSNTFWGMQHLNGNMLCSIGILKTGHDLDVHEIFDIGVIPIDAAMNKRNDKHIFHMGIKPENTNIRFTCEVTKKALADKILHSKDAGSVGDVFISWFESLKLNPGKKIVPLAWNWPEMSIWLRNWLGNKTFDYIFDWRFRDVLGTANHINDTLDQSINDVVFPKITIGSMAMRMNIERIRPETALTRAKLTLDLYDAMCTYRTKPML